MQPPVSRFLLKALSSLTVADPFPTKKTDVVVYSFVDVEDLFYSIPRAELFESVNSCIDANDGLSFQTAAGVTVDNFLTLLEAY